jgi:hypothetical protein
VAKVGKKISFFVHRFAAQRFLDSGDSITDGFSDQRPRYAGRDQGDAMSTFSLGQILATPGALELLRRNGQGVDEFLARHARGDWGEVCKEDAHWNDQGLQDGSRLLSVYRTRDRETLWIITEAADEQGSRSATTVLLPSEY